MRFSMVLMILVFVALPCAAQPQDTLRMPDLVREALSANPMIQAMNAGVQAARAREGQVGLLDPPELTYMREQMPHFNWSEPMMEKWELMQMIPFPTKLPAERSMASVKTAIEEQSRRQLQVTLEMDVATTFAELWFAQEASGIVEQSQKLLRDLLAIAETRYGAGNGGRGDVLRLTVEALRLENELRDLRRQRATLRAMLDALVNQKDHDRNAVAVLPDAPARLPSLDSLYHIAVRNRPSILKDSLDVEMGRRELSLADNGYWPDLKVGVQYVHTPMPELRGWSIIAGISLPFAPWSIGKTQSAIEEAEAHVHEALASADAAQSELRAELVDLHGRVRVSQDEWTAFRERIVPQSLQAFDAQLVAYRSGRGMLVDVLESYKMLLEVQRDAAMTRARLEQDRARLRKAVGMAFSDGTM